MNRIAVTRPRLHLPAIAGLIEWRVLVNFRCDPQVLAPLLPAPFRPKLVNGWGVAGICLIRLGNIRLAFLPPLGGFTSENAAHRIAVEWDDGTSVREGVFIPRRDTNSWLNRLAGGRLFPGVHHAAEFQIREDDNRFEIELRSEDGAAFVRVMAQVANELPGTSVFRSLDEASTFFRVGSLGWSSPTDGDEFDGLELLCRDWRMEPLAIEHVESSFFADVDLFPPGSAAFDSALLMRNLEHEWHARGRLAAREIPMG